MTVFDDLNAQYAKFDTAVHLQCHLLVKSIGELAIKLEKYLGLPHTYWFKENGQRGGRYVRLGTGTPKNFKEEAWPTLSCLGGVVSYSLALALTDLEPGEPRFHYVFEGTVQFVNDGYEFGFLGLDHPVVVSAEDVEAGNFDAVYKEMVNLVKSRINPEDILIKRAE